MTSEELANVSTNLEYSTAFCLGSYFCVFWQSNVAHWIAKPSFNSHALLLEHASQMLTVQYIVHVDTQWLNYINIIIVIGYQLMP